MNIEKIKYIKKIAKNNEEKIEQLTDILTVLDDIRTGHINTYDDIITDNNYEMWYSKKNIYLMEKLLKKDVNTHILYLIVYIRLKNEGIFDNFENRVYNSEVLSTVYECTYDLISALDLWKYCTPTMLDDLCLH